MKLSTSTGDFSGYSRSVAEKVHEFRGTKFKYINLEQSANVTILPGVTFGEGTVIGAGSVVTKDIPAGCIAAGNPCRVIRMLTNADSMVNKPEILGDCKPL